MQNFQGIIFIRIRTYRGIFQICISVPLRNISFAENFTHRLHVFSLQATPGSNW